MELDELCVKNICLWTAVDRATNQLAGFKISIRETKYFQKPTNKISHIDAKFYASDYWHAYNLIEPTKPRESPIETFMIY